MSLHEKSGSPFLTQAFFLSLFLFGSKNPKYIFEILRCAQNDKMKWIPSFGPFAKVQKRRFEIAARFFKSLAMTWKSTLCHCEERSDEAISTFSTSPFAGMTGASRTPRQTKLNHRPVILNTTKTPKRPSSSTTALNIRMSCVLGFKIFHTKTQRATISDIRKIKDIKSVNIVI